MKTYKKVPRGDKKTQKKIPKDKRTKIPKDTQKDPARDKDIQQRS